MSAPIARPGAVDLHAHFLPTGYRRALLARDQGHPDGMPALPAWSEASALETMDATGIAAAALSLSSPGVAFLDSTAERAACVRDVNDEGAAAVAGHPHRFALLASLPLPDVDAALAELTRAFDVLQADGVGLHTHYDGVYLGDPRLEPVLAELDLRHAVVTVHPVSPCGSEQVAFGRPRPLVEFVFETTRAVINLALSGAFDRFPHIQWVVPHAGAALPVIADRIDRLYPAVCPDDTSPASLTSAMRRLNYDLAGVPLPHALPALLRLTSIDQLVYGSDYPFMPVPQILELARELQRTDVLDDAAKAAAFRANALRMFPRLAGSETAATQVRDPVGSSEPFA